MEDLTKEATKLASDIQALVAEREQCNNEANILENEAKEKRARAFECKKSIQALQTALNNVQVKNRILTDEQATAKARTEAEEHTKNLESEVKKAQELRKQLEQMVANATPEKESKK